VPPGFCLGAESLTDEWLLAPGDSSEASRLAVVVIGDRTVVTGVVAFLRAICLFDGHPITFWNYVDAPRPTIG
jgi:hypothetical protein